MEKKLQLYSIMPLDTDHLEEICADIKAQYDAGVADCALFSMTLVPEGNPPVDKVTGLCEKYDLFRDRLAEMGVECGVLVQATLGHGWVLGEMFPYQPIVQLVDGKNPFSVCPADEGFRDYVRGVMATIASHRPAHIMLDDDFRLMFRPGGGCACPLHLSRFEQLYGKRMEREELLSLVSEKSAEGERASLAFVETQRDSLVECARIMRDAIDAVDPTIPGSFCCVSSSSEFGAEVAEIFAGKGHPSVLRIHNSRYSALGPKYFTQSFLRAAASIEKVAGKVDVVLAETDTCPQNRYSTSARSLHSHFTGSILEGANGAKHWITRLSAHEPASGRAYRKLLGRYRGFYETLAQTVPMLSPRGFRIPVSGEPKFPLGRGWVECPDMGDDWSRCVLERMGLPLYFSSKAGGAVCLSGETDVAFSDAQILEMLHGTVVLSSDAARRLIDRGFGEYLGVDVREWTGKTPTTELILINDNRCGRQMQLKELVPLYAGVREDSSVLHTLDRVHYERLFPGSTAYENSLGGRVFVFAGTPRAEHDIKEAYSFLNYSRKLQLTALLEEAGELPLWYPDDEEVYLRVADVKGGGLFAAVFNLSSDPLEEPIFGCKTPVRRVERLNADGAWESVPFDACGEDAYRLHLCVEHLLPEVLIFYGV